MLRVGFALLSDDRPFAERWGWEDQDGGRAERAESSNKGSVQRLSRERLCLTAVKIHSD